MWYVYTMEYYSAIKRNEIMSFGKMDGTEDHHVSWNKPDSERQILHILSHMWNLVKKNQKKKPDSRKWEREPVGEGRRG
jgi:hypothetical protein